MIKPKSISHGGKPKPKPSLGQPNPNPQQVHLHGKDDFTPEETPDNHTQTMVHECLAACDTHPSDIQNVMSVLNVENGTTSPESPRQFQVNQRYVFTTAKQSTNHLIDRGAIEGLAGADMRILQTTHRKINIVGIDDHELTGLHLVTAAALLDTQKGPIIGIFHEYAHLGKGKSIHAAGQMEWFHCQADDRSKVVGGAPRIETPDGYAIPLSIESGLVYMQSIRIPTDKDLKQYPYVFFTSPDSWDASVLNHGITPSLLEEIHQDSDDSLIQDSFFDEFGELQHRVIQQLNIFGIQHLQLLGSTPFILIYIRVVMLNQIGNN